jgi:hypothetical protein
MRAIRVGMLVASLVVAMLPVAASGGQADVSLETTKRRYLDSENARVTLINHGEDRIELRGGEIRNARNGDIMVRLRPNRPFLPPSGEHDWTWIHGGNAGSYVATVRTSAGRLRVAFEIGAYFTLGFEGSDASFVIYPTKERPIRQLRADLKQNEGKRRIVSGIVQGDRAYNPDWSYSMGHGSIILGEVFVEVCDASPSYVENHRNQWMGERWCPWSSHVEREGR